MFPQLKAKAISNWKECKNLNTMYRWYIHQLFKSCECLEIVET